MKKDDRLLLVKRRMEQASVALEDARFLRDGGRSPQSVVNRAYHAMFYAVLALLQEVGSVPSKHTGAIGLFDPEFVMEGVFAKQDVCSKSPAGDSPNGRYGCSASFWEWAADWFMEDYYCNGEAATGDGECPEDAQALPSQLLSRLACRCSVEGMEGADGRKEARGVGSRRSGEAQAAEI